MKEGQNEEIKQTIGEELYEEYKKGNLSSDEVALIVMYDMGWKKRSSGSAWICHLKKKLLKKHKDLPLIASNSFCFCLSGEWSKS